MRLTIDATDDELEQGLVAARRMLAALKPFAAGFPNNDKRDYIRAAMAVLQATEAGITVE